MFGFFGKKKRIPPLDAPRIQRHCGLTAAVYRQVDSTNEIAKAFARQGAPAYTTVVAASQTAGKGRGDHSFFSPEGTGVYISVILRPTVMPLNPAEVTAAAGVAAAETVEALSQKKAAIKWMNDIYLDGKKVAGILAESSFTREGPFIVVGVGFNLTDPEEGFPEEFACRAASVFGDAKIGDSRERAVITFFRKLESRMRSAEEDTYRAYRKRLFILGRRVEWQGREAAVTDLDGEYRLELTFDDGEKRLLDSGEVSLPVYPEK